MSRFYDAVDESLSLISARSPNCREQEKRGKGSGMVAHPDRPSTSLCLLVNFAQRLRIVQVVRLAVSASGAACRASAVVTRFIPCSCHSPPTPLFSCLTFAFLAQHSFGFLIYAQFNLRFLFYLKLIIYYFFLLRFLLAFGN